MLRTLVAMLLMAHGLLHVLGFLKQWQLATVSQLSGKSWIHVSDETSKLLGLLWLLVCLGFLLAMVTCLLQRDWWLLVAGVSVVLSQVLIIIYWPDAHAGTLVNVGIALVLVLAYSHDRFEMQADREVRQLLRQPADDQRVVTPKMLNGLPTPVQQWLQASGIVGKERVHTVRLRQTGLMRTSPEGRWMPTKAVQYFGVDKPGFVWEADVRMLPFLPLSGRDKYADGKGNMLIKALSLVPVVNASDAKTDQGTLLRYLGEMCWFPSAALSPFIQWRAIDATHAQATMSYKGVSATAVFAFDEQHRLTSVSANRYMGGGKDGKLEKWYIPVRDWKEMDGVVIPVKGDVIWRLPTGDFDYYQWEITDIDYNYPVLY
ncbi:hypothetical protein EXU85_02355 [Spirosoma sp. KCTC 42546]|uniref:DUF6544 family protein n=1 Tax=Spirosoma sp. KCTC 42546 TaxID=2520506 RepID=UPI00115752A9|nr:DUF6544 family protein [Spirosoma sp. KCTC 42546]QDK77500.1 hypothetical protein EXU85_02355 [Spirosoma sp. KCTC 42546]